MYPPLPTPFTGEGALDLGPLRDLVARLSGSGLAGFLALGSNGEAVHVSADEASLVYRAVREAAPRGLRVLAGTGQQSTAATLDMTRRAADAGCDAALVLTPSYYRGAMTNDALRRHYETVAGASPIPILVYNVPVSSGLNIAPALVAELARHPNIIGVKDSSGDISQLAELVRLTRPSTKSSDARFEVLSGSFGSLLPGLLVGAVGGVIAIANVFPGMCVSLQRLHDAGRFEEARELHLRYLPAARAVTSRFGVPGLKAALAAIGTPAGFPRAPLLPLAGEDRAEVEKIVSALPDVGVDGRAFEPVAGAAAG